MLAASSSQSGCRAQSPCLKSAFRPISHRPLLHKRCGSAGNCYVKIAKSDSSLEALILQAWFRKFKEYRLGPKRLAGSPFRFAFPCFRRSTINGNNMMPFGQSPSTSVQLNFRRDRAVEGIAHGYRLAPDHYRGFVVNISAHD